MNSNNINNFKMLKFEQCVPLCLCSDSYRNGGYYSMLCHKDTKFHKDILCKHNKLLFIYLCCKFYMRNFSYLFCYKHHFNQSDQCTIK